MIQKGDTVRFLNAVGGGVVVRVDELKKLVYVEDEDGFEIPILERECVLIEQVNSTTNFPVKDFLNKSLTSIPEKKLALHFDPESEKIVETQEGEKLNVLLAFFPIDIKQLQTTSYECYLLNDSNYFLNYNLVNAESDAWESIANGIIEPNTQEFVAVVSKVELRKLESLQVQLLPYKKGKKYIPQSAIDVFLKISGVKFYKLHSFTSNDYFDEPAMLVDVISERDKQVEIKKMMHVSPDEIRKAMFQKEDIQRKSIEKKTSSHEIIEVDLHIHELIETTSGMSNGDMLQCQLDKFHAVIEENKNRKGQKIVFIHGKGEGVLRKEIEKQLKFRYKSFNYQDASFREYGFGATMITIR
jgi:hypothetical protein